MSRLIQLVMTCLALLGLTATSAMAQSRCSSSIFSVPMVEVYADGATAAKAQGAAQDMGRRRAMDMLLRRLTAEEDWTYLPRLQRGEAAPSAGVTVPTLDPIDGGEIVSRAKQAVSLVPQQLASMEEGFAIFDEKTSGTSYRAKISYRFKSSEVRNALQAANLPYSDAQARCVLVLPVLETASGLYLWESNNPWARAWLARPLVNELTPMVLPIGDRQDVETASARDVKRLSQSALQAFATRYNVDQVIVAQGKLQEKDGEFRLFVRLIDGYLKGRSGADSAAEDAARLYDDEDGFGAPAVASSGLGSAGRVLAETFFRGADDDFPALAARAVESSVSRYAQGWKLKTLVDHSAVRRMSLTAWFGSLDEWGGIRRALDATPLVKAMDVGAFNNENAVIDLAIIGSDEQLILAMQQARLALWQSSDGEWNIADYSRAQGLQLELERIVQQRIAEDEAASLNRPQWRRGNRDQDANDRGREDDALDLDALDRVLNEQQQGPVALEAPVTLEDNEDDGEQ